jgi:hypothetical protein
VAHSASITRSGEDEVFVERGVFGLMDLDTASCPVPWPADLIPPEETVRVMTNRVDFNSAARNHVVAVRFEAWDGEPPQDPREREEEFDEEETQVELTSGEVRLWELTGGASARTFLAGPRGGRYGLLVRCYGRDEALGYEIESLAVPRGTERYLLRFWPKDGV